MDKQNYTLKTEKSQEIRQIFSKIKYYLRKKMEKTEVIQRKRTIKSCASLINAAYLYIFEQLSYRRLSYEMAIRYCICMSDTAWRKRLIHFIPVFLEVCQQCISEDAAQSNQSYFHTKSPIFALDTTVIPVEGGQSSPTYIHTCCSLKDHSLEQSHITDCHTAESVKNFKISPNALYIADRAYGRTNQMAYMIKNQAHFIFRISPNQVCLYRTRNLEEKLNFEELLSGGAFFKTVYIQSDKDVFEVQLFGAPIPEDKIEQALKRAARQAQKKQFDRSEISFEYSKWLFLVTSLPASETSENRMLNLYSDRWQIELLFKRAKSLLHFHRARRATDDPKKAQTHYTVSLWWGFMQLLSYIQLAIAGIVSFLMSDFQLFSLASCWLF